MNKHRQTEHRISWTNVGLNVLLPMFKDVESLQSNLRNSNIGFVAGTHEDIEHMVDVIQKKVGITNMHIRHAWKPDIWYCIQISTLNK